MAKKYYMFILLGVFILLTGTLFHAQKSKKEENDVIKWKVVSVWSRNNPIYQDGMKKFALDVEEISNKKIKIEFYAVGEYHDIQPYDVFDAVANGTVEMGFGTSLYWAKEKIPGSEFFYAVPFGLNANDMHAWLYRGRGLELWRELYEPFNVIPFPVGDTGGAWGGWFRNEITGIESFKNLKIRLDGFGKKVLEEKQARPTWMKSDEALGYYEKKEIDAIVCLGPFTDQRYDLHRTRGYYYYPGWQEPCGVISLIINKTAWDGLPENLKKTIETVCGHTYQFIRNQFERMNSLALKEFIEQQDVTLIEFPPEVLDELRKLSEEFLENKSKEDSQFAKIYKSYKKFEEENIRKYGWNKNLYDADITDEIAKEFSKKFRDSKVTTVAAEGNNRIVISMSGDIFSSSKRKPKPKDILKSEIASTAETLKLYSKKITFITVECYVNEWPNDKLKNDQLSVKRANAVAKLLTDNKIKASLIKNVIPGDAGPKDSNETEEGSVKNNRVEINIFW